MALGTRCLTWYEGAWHDGNYPILGAADHGTWQGDLVFDGARFFEGTTPDLDLHCARLLRSAEIMGLAPTLTAAEIVDLTREGIRRLGSDRPLYLRPMLWARDGSPAIRDPDPGTTAFALCLEDLPMRLPGPMPLTLSPFRRPSPDSALTEAKAACHYANNARIIREARARGFHNALSLDQQGFVAETASTNVVLVRDGTVATPAPNGTFLNGITRQRILALLRADGLAVEETPLLPADFAAADEIFLTGNASKVVPVTLYEERKLRPGPVAARARALYWDFAHAARVAA